MKTYILIITLCSRLALLGIALRIKLEICKSLFSTEVLLKPVKMYVRIFTYILIHENIASIREETEMWWALFYLFIRWIYILHLFVYFVLYAIINLSFSFLLLLMLLPNSGLLKGIPKADLEFELLLVSRDKAFGSSFFFPSIYCNVVLNQGHEMLVQYKQPWY